jgi:predicted Zn finger-like uncharacterized protein
VHITCHQCATQFELGDDRIPPGGARVRCSICKHAFFVDHPGSTSEPADPVQRAVEEALAAEFGETPDVTHDLDAPPVRRGDSRGDRRSDSISGREEGEGSWEFAHENSSSRSSPGRRREARSSRAAAQEAVDALLGARAPRDAWAAEVRPDARRRVGVALDERDEDRLGASSRVPGADAAASAPREGGKTPAAPFRVDEGPAAPALGAASDELPGLRDRSGDALEFDEADEEAPLEVEQALDRAPLEVDEAREHGAVELDDGGGHHAVELDDGGGHHAVELDDGGGHHAVELDDGGGHHALELDDGGGDHALDLDDGGGDHALDLDDGGARAPYGHDDVDVVQSRAPFGEDAPPAASEVAEEIDRIESFDEWDVGDEPADRGAPSGLSLGRIGEFPASAADLATRIGAAERRRRWLSPWLRRIGHGVGWALVAALFSVGLVGSLARTWQWGPEAGPQLQRLAGIEASAVEGRLVENALAGPIYVVSAELRNPEARPVVPGARFVVRLLDAHGAPLGVEPAAVAPALGERRLRESDPRALREIQARAGEAFAGATLAPRSGVRVHAVVGRLPQDARRFELEAVPVKGRKSDAR